LVEVASIISSSLELDAVLGHILDQATRILNAESGSIMLLNGEGTLLKVVAAHGPRSGTITGLEQSVSEGIAGWVAQHGEPLLLHGTTSDPTLRPVCERSDVRDALCAPLGVDKQILGVINLNNCQSGRKFSQDDLDLLTALANQAALAIRNARSYDEMRHQRRTVERLLEEVTRAQEQERMRIALQLHDGPAQTLHASLRNLEVARALAHDAAEPLTTAMSELERTIRHAIKTTRAVMIDLRPPGNESQGLITALRQYLSQYETRTGIETHLLSRGSDERLPKIVESSFYRIAQEALTNIWKHAGASNAWVEVWVREGTCALEIRDDGQGFDPDVVAESESQHLGLRSLRERAELAGGRLTLKSAIGNGTLIRVAVPLMD
jgi:signal transduction histidine kinase